MQTQLAGIACRRFRTPQHILDNILIEFDGPKIGIMGDFNSSWLPPGCYNARDGELTVVPGLIDVHVHGCGGADFLDKKAESLARISETAAQGGATSIAATTTIPTDDEQLEGFAEFVRLVRTTPLPGARVFGIHLEGPFLNPEKRGGFGMRFIQPIDLKKAERILSLCGDLLLKITLSPELDESEKLIRLIHENPGTQIEITLGHTSADFEMAQRFFNMERVKQVTHAFNAMHPFHHRSPNLIGAALLDDRVWMEMIPDGHHLVGGSIELLNRLKGRRRLMIVTDGTAATATPPGTLIESVGGLTEVRDGAVRLTNGALAGSNMLMADAFASAQRLGGISFEDALAMCTETPARSVHCEDQIGFADRGKRADFCILKKDGAVAATIRDGMLVYENVEVC